jgi:UDP-N-acetylglucosamine 2-epimerase (non-hydrolysing)
VTAVLQEYKMPTQKKIMLVFGTRPEAIKMAPLFHAFANGPAHLRPIVCVTGQHRQMLDQTLAGFNITPDIDLNIMRPGQDLFDVTSNVLTGMREVIDLHQPDILLVHGDTTTSLATAMAGFYKGIPVGHVEAGLRTHDLTAPFPEEFNRQVTGKIATWHFAPTAASRDNLLAENVRDDQIMVTGNTVIDALHWMLNRIDSDPVRRAALDAQISAHLSFAWTSQKMVLITGHRRENFGDGFLQICHALKSLAQQHSDVHFVYPVHLNPNVQAPVNEILGGLHNVHLIPPLDYEPFVHLLRHSYIILTDSGGIQEEGPSLGKPVLVMRDVTERPEAIAAGTVRLVGANQDQIIRNVNELLVNNDVYQMMSQAHNPYGDGKACARIVEFLGQLN